MNKNKRKDEIIRLAQEGKRTDEIAKQLRISEAEVVRFLEKAGFIQ